MQPTPGWRGFATRPLGRVVLIAVAILAVTFGTLYISEVIGIAILLLFGLALPIYMGWKRPRGLAIAGAIILLVSAPIASVLVTQQYFQAPGAVNSYGGAGESGGYVLQNAVVNPFSSGSSQSFQFSVTVVPAHLVRNATIQNLTLFVSTCPDATAPNQTTSVCSPPFPSHQMVHHFTTAPTSELTVTFNQSLDGPHLWWWTVWATYSFPNESGSPAHYIFLYPNNGYNDIQGPVVGDFFGILTIVIVPVYLALLIYPGLVFYVALLFYAWFKAREARRKQAAAGSEPPASPSPAAPSAGAPADAQKPDERRCPKCAAVVYANETQCWKCGTALPRPSTPLPSEPPKSA